MQDAVVRLSKKRLLNLILMPIREVDERKVLRDFGVHSMIASGSRSWFWAVFRVNVPFVHSIMSLQRSLRVLAEFAQGEILPEMTD